MTYFELFAKCFAIATKSSVEDITAKFKEYSEYKEPNPLMNQEAPEQVVKDLLFIAKSDPESVISFALKGIPAALSSIRNISKH